MKSLWVALGIIGSIVVVIVILNTGGATVGPEDPRGDVAVSAGDSPPEDTSLADITRTEVRRDGDRILFEATLSQEIPRKVSGGALEFRWDISENGDETWIVTANLSSRLTAAITSQNTSYGSSTIDDTLPGTVAVDGDILTITLQASQSEKEEFPATFEWILTTTLDADLTDTSSAVATDSAPGTHQ